jgi:HD superfamily phosphohydrolase
LEIRDPIHQFIAVSELERRVIDTRPVQRLRGLHQLSTGWLVFPGARHSRFEHSLGTMELAGRALTAAFHNSDPGVLNSLGLGEERTRRNMLAVVRLGGLLHDLGHPPFSHGPEALLPLEDGRVLTHEEITERIIRGSEVAGAIRANPIDSVDLDSVIDIALGPKYRTIANQTVRLLSDLVTGTVGVDRMDYLLRDTLYTGVAYGRFDIDRLIGSLFIVDHPELGPVWALPTASQYDAEQMLLARWFMFLQVYNHKTRRILDYHLVEYLRQEALAGGRFPSDINDYMALSDFSILDQAYRSSSSLALALLGRQHLRLVEEFSRRDFIDLDGFRQFVTELQAKYPTVYCDDFTVALTKEGDGELWVETNKGLEALDSFSYVIATLKPRWIGRIYSPLDERGEVSKALRRRRENRSDA